MPRKDLVPSTFDVNQLPILMCRRTGYIQIETTSPCPICGAKKHFHGISLDMLDGTPSHRSGSGHCQKPPRGMKDKQSLAAWWQTVARGYRIRLAT